MAHGFGIKMRKSILFVAVVVVIEYFAQFSQNSGSQGLFFTSHRYIVSFANTDQFWFGED